ncbi:MAG: hypothetical protein LKI58_11685 [Actinomyces sp.]|nr:hypothetical protein [Actinomyces sp.]MCI1788698.1 hypothetical protein [Actinomyces sp.]MCI1829255.1 hypothetical protein [Actinomyces sp.]
MLADLTERHYLELKGPENLNSKADKQKIAKFILGAANRSPERAAEAFEGYGVMVIGITKNGAEGIDPIETLELQKVIKPFLGEAGPHWDVVRVPVDGSTKQVLVVLVDPPKVGQPAFICRDNGDKLTSGHVYFRDDGETRQANAGEMDMIAAGGAAKSAAPVDIAVSVVGVAVPVIIDEKRSLDKCISVEREALIAALPRLKPSKPASAQGGPGVAIGYQSAIAELSKSLSAANFFGGIPEERTRDEYLASIDDWEARFRKAWPKAVRRFAGYTLDAAEVQVLNRAKTFLHDVEVKVHLEGDVRALDYKDLPKDADDIQLKLPAPPREWGPRQRDFGLAGINPSLYGGLSMNPNDFKPSSSTWKNTGSVDVNVYVGDLRPEDTVTTDDEDSVLVFLGEAPEFVRATWRATARGYDDVFTGETKVEVGEPRDLTDAMRYVLGLDDGDDED